MKNYFLFMILLFIGSCVHLRTNDQQKKPLVESKELETVDGSDESTVNPPEVPLIEKQSPPQLGLILSAGGARALAHAGVLKALEERRIKITAIVGMEWGALSAALFAEVGRSHAIDWAIFKLKDQDWQNQSLFKLNFFKPKTEALDQYLKLAVPDKNIEDLSLPFACPSLNVTTGKFMFIESGPIKNALRSCMALQPLVDSDQQVASPWAISEAAQWLMDQGATEVVLLNVIGDEKLLKAREGVDRQVLLQWSELRRQMARRWPGVSSRTINLEGFYLDSFSDKVKILKLGHRQGVQLADELIRLRGF